MSNGTETKEADGGLSKKEVVTPVPIYWNRLGSLNHSCLQNHRQEGSRAPRKGTHHFLDRISTCVPPRPSLDDSAIIGVKHKARRRNYGDVIVVACMESSYHEVGEGGLEMMSARKPITTKGQ